MAVRLPDTYDRRRVPSFERPMARHSGGAAIGSAVQDLGQGFAAVAQAAFNVDERNAAQEALEKDTEVGRKIQDLLYNPETGFMFSRGGNAVAGREAIMAKVREIESEAMNGVRGRVASKLRPALSRRIDATMSSVNRHTGTERGNAIRTTLGARIELAGSEAASRWADEGLMAEAVNEGMKNFDALASVNGWSGEKLEVERKKFASGIYANAALSRAATDPGGALDFVRKNADKFLPDARATLEQRLQPLADAQAGREAVHNYYNSGTVSLPTTGSLDRNDPAFGKKIGGMAKAIAPAVINTESGGVPGQVGAKGELGVGQFMGDTAKAAAKRLGVEYDEGKLLNDPAYGAMLVEEEMRFLLDKYDGNMAMALAGYNGGQGFVNQMIRQHGDPRTNAVTTDAWVAKLPNKEYITKTMGAAGAASSGDTSGPSRITWAAHGTRRMPIHDHVLQAHERVARSLGSDIGITVHSAAQPKPGEGPRKGSTRHDHDGSGKGETIDLKLTRNGKIITPSEDPELYRQAIYAYAAQGFTGIGHYSWGIHVGGGAPAFWGPDTTSATADLMFKDAYDQGRKAFLAGGGGGYKSGASVVGGAVAMIRATPPGPVRDAMVAELKLQETLRTAEAEAARSELSKQAWAHVASGGSMNTLSPETLIGLGRTETSALMEIERKLRSGAPIETDMNVWYGLNQMRADRPHEFANANLTEYFPYLSQADQKKIIEEQVKARKDPGVAPSYGGLQQITNNLAPGLIDWKADHGSSAGQKRVAFYMEWTREIDGFIEANGKKPNDAEKQEIVTRLLETVVEGGTFSDETRAYELRERLKESAKTGEPVDIGDGIQATAAQIDEYVESYKRRLASKGLPVPPVNTMSQAVQAYHAERNYRAGLGPDPVAAPRMGGSLGAPTMDDIPTLGGADSVPAAPGEPGTPDVPARLNRFSGAMRSPGGDPMEGVTDGIVPPPETNDPIEWDAFGRSVAMTMMRLDGLVVLPGGIEADMTDWLNALDVLSADLEPGQDVSSISPGDIVQEILRAKAEDG